MEKVQVRFAVPAPENGTPLGTPILAVFTVVKDGVQTWRIYGQSSLGWQEVAVDDWPAGMMRAHDADVLALGVGNSLYDFVATYIGLQELLPFATD